MQNYQHDETNPIFTSRVPSAQTRMRRGCVVTGIIFFALLHPDSIQRVRQTMDGGAKARMRILASSLLFWPGVMAKAIGPSREARRGLEGPYYISSFTNGAQKFVNSLNYFRPPCIILLPRAPEHWPRLGHLFCGSPDAGAYEASFLFLRGKHF